MSDSVDKLKISGYHDIEVSVLPYKALPIEILLLGDGLNWWTSMSWDDWGRLVAFVNWRRADSAKEVREFEQSLEKE